MRKVSYIGDVKNTVQVVGRNVPISRKIGREIAVFIKGKYVDRAIAELEQVAKGKLAIPYNRFNRDTPHRRGNMTSGRFPRSASLQIVKLLKSLRANAENKALSEEDILIVHAACQHAGIAWHYGRHRRRRRKLAHFELVGVEKEREEKKEEKKKKQSPPSGSPAESQTLSGTSPAVGPPNKPPAHAVKKETKKAEKKPAKKPAKKKTEKKPVKKKPAKKKPAAKKEIKTRSKQASHAPSPEVTEK